MISMLVAKRSDGSRVVASEEHRDNGPWVCPSCSTQVSLKKGQIKIHHFAHYPPVSCEYGSGESEEHRRCKTSIYEALRSMTNASQWELERDLGSVRPDVSGYIGVTPVAIEVQASSLGLERIIHRTKEYATKGIFVLWLVPRRGSCLEKADDERFAPSVWEKWLHTLYFGRVYYWVGGADVLPVHFDKHMLWVEETDWDGGHGGYHRVSKRFREVNSFSYPYPISDMRGVDRNAWAGGKMNIPQSKIWIDGLPRWWLDTP